MEKYQQALINNLKKYRLKNKISQAQLAELCDVATGTIGNIECGVAKPSFDLLIAMARVLSVTPSELLEDKETKEKDNASKISEHLLLLEIYSKLKDNLFSD